MYVNRVYNLNPKDLSSASSISSASAACFTTRQYPASAFRNSNRDNLGNRNHRNPRYFSDLNFSNRDKLRGVPHYVAARYEQRDSEPSRRAASPPSSEACSGRRRRIQILIATQLNRNLLNSTGINETHRSNRNKRRGPMAPVRGAWEMHGGSTSLSEAKKLSLHPGKSEPRMNINHAGPTRP